MTSYVALLRAVNLGPHNKMPKEVLTAVAGALGYARARTYIASGNLLFDADENEAEVKAALQRALADHAGKPMPVMVRTGTELAAIRDANPFTGAPGNRVVVMLLDVAPPADALEHARNAAGEGMALGKREIYVRYTDRGMGQSKLIIPAAKAGTARNMNTVAKLAELALSRP
jgi:uncharacterized protein (DUF1697 family)